MTFYSGFSIQGEESLFAPFLDESDFCVAGFSLGAIKAIEYALVAPRRIDKLQLFSPAFFQHKSEKFKRLQLLHFQKDKTTYTRNFLENISYPSKMQMQSYYHDSDIDALKKLLYFVWDKKMLETLTNRAIMIELFLGQEDKIIDAQQTKEFFQDFATIIMIKDAGHILQKDKHG